MEVDTAATGTWLVVLSRQLDAPDKSELEHISGPFYTLRRGPRLGDGVPDFLTYNAFSKRYGRISMYPIPPNSRFTVLGLSTSTAGHAICFDVLLADDVLADSESILPRLAERAGVRIWADLYRRHGKQIEMLSESGRSGLLHGDELALKVEIDDARAISLDFLGARTQRLCVARYRPSIPL